MQKHFVRLRIRMLECGINQKQLAEMVGMSTATLSSRMAGSSPWNTQEMQRIGDALDIPPEEYYYYFIEGGKAIAFRQNGRQESRDKAAAR